MTEAEIKEEEYDFHQKQQVEIRNTNLRLESDSVPQSMQFMIDIIPTTRTLIQIWPIWRIRVLYVGSGNGAGTILLATTHGEYFFYVKMCVDALDIEPRFKPYADQGFPNIKYIVEDML